MRPRRPRAPAAYRPVLCPSSGRNPSILDHQSRAHRSERSFLYDFATDVRPPVECPGIGCPPLFGALAAEQLRQGESRDCAADDNVPVLRFDIQTLAAAQLDGLYDVAGKPDG